MPSCRCVALPAARPLSRTLVYLTTPYVRCTTAAHHCHAELSAEGDRSLQLLRGTADRYAPGADPLALWLAMVAAPAASAGTTERVRAVVVVGGRAHREPGAAGQEVRAQPVVAVQGAQPWLSRSSAPSRAAELIGRTMIPSSRHQVLQVWYQRGALPDHSEAVGKALQHVKSLGPVRTEAEERAETQRQEVQSRAA